MLISVPRETKVHEYRVGLTPDSVASLTTAGHNVWVQNSAGQGVGFDDEDYRRAGARIVDLDDAFAGELVIKVKEPNLAECECLQSGQVLFTYLHLAAAPAIAAALVARGVVAIAYETVADAAGHLPLLAPMSEVAGRMSVQVGANALQKANGGRGTLLGGIPGVAPAYVVILGGGMAGTNAAEMAIGLQARVTILDRSISQLRALNERFGVRAQVLMASEENIANTVRDADLVIGAVLVPGANAPKLVDRALLRQMLPGAVLVDISIDQGGCFATSRPTTHDDPTYVEEGIVHYCVANMPGAVARTATIGLNNVTLPYVHALANHGWRHALDLDPGFAAGLNVAEGRVVHPAVADALSVGVAA
ncbi:MAG: alanine dehydrogenase [Pseudomonadota bacterium]